MLNSRHLATGEKRVEYLMRDVTDEQRDELARLAVLLHSIYRHTLAAGTRRSIDEVLGALAPDFLLTFRALSEQAGQIVRTRKY